MKSAAACRSLQRFHIVLESGHTLRGPSTPSTLEAPSAYIRTFRCPMRQSFASFPVNPKTKTVAEEQTVADRRILTGAGQFLLTVKDLARHLARAVAVTLRQYFRFIVA